MTARLLLIGALLGVAVCGCKKKTPGGQPVAVDPAQGKAGGGVMATEGRVDAWKLNLTRYLKQGDTYTYKFKLMQSLRFRASTGVLSGRGKDHLEARGKVTSTIARSLYGGRIGTEMATVEDFQVKLKLGGPWRRLRVSDHALKVVRSPAVEITRIDGNPLGDTELRTLGFLFHEVDPLLPSDQDIFGREDKVRVGDKWQPHMKQFTELLTMNTCFRVVVRDAKGSMAVVDRRRQNDQDGLYAVGTVDFSIDAYPDYAQMRGRAKGVFSGHYPFDDAELPTAITSRVSTTVGGTVQDLWGDLQVSANGEHSHTVTEIKRIKPDVTP